jgi:hypothetical protein
MGFKDGHQELIRYPKDGGVRKTILELEPGFRTELPHDMKLGASGATVPFLEVIGEGGHWKPQFNSKGFGDIPE